MPFFAGSLPPPKSFENFENLLPIHRALRFTHAADRSQLSYGFWLFRAQLLQRGVMHYHERRSLSFSRRGPSPLPQKFPQIFIQGDTHVRLKCGSLDPFLSMTPRLHPSYLSGRKSHPLRRSRANIANAALSPLCRLPKVLADSLLSALA